MIEPFLSISEMSARLGVPAHTLRYWERQFPSAVKPTTGAGGRRYYREEVAAALMQIKDLLYDEGMTIAGVKKLIAKGEIKKNKSEPKGVLEADIHSRHIQAGGNTDIKKAVELLESARNDLV